MSKQQQLFFYWNNTMTIYVTTAKKRAYKNKRINAT